MSVVSPKMGIAIDGHNFGVMRRDFGIEETNFRSLVHCLRKIGGDIPFVQEPRSTISPQHYKPGCRLHDDMRRAGIVMRPAESWNEADDNLVMKWGCRYVQHPQVAVTVIVTNDTGIIETLLTTVEDRLDRSQQVIHVVGTCQLNRTGRYPISKGMVRYLQRHEHTAFTDLFCLVKHIGRRGTVH